MQYSHYDDYFRTFTADSFENQVDWHWFKAQGLAESMLNPSAISGVGAIGVMQLMPGTSKEMAGILGIDDLPYQSDVNIRMGIAYCKRCWDIWKAENGIERLRFAFGSYNAGPGNIITAQRLAKKDGLPTDQWSSIVKTLPRVTGRHAKETITYVERIERFYRQLCNGEIA